MSFQYRGFRMYIIVLESSDAARPAFVGSRACVGAVGNSLMLHVPSLSALTDFQLRLHFGRLGKKFLDQLFKGLFPCLFCSTHGLKVDRRLLNLACISSSINLPSPRFGSRRSVLHNN